MNETGGTAKKYRHDNEQGSRSNMGKGGKNKSSGKNQRICILQLFIKFYNSNYIFF